MKPSSKFRVHEGRLSSSVFSKIEADDWRDRAVCRDADPDTFFCKPGESWSNVHQRAEQWCTSCPVRRECREFGRTQSDGYWGGVVRKDSHHVKFRTAPVNRSGCATNAGYQQHVLAGEEPCPACKGAHTEYNRRWRRPA